MKKSHNFFSNLAFNLAEIHLGKTNTNPSVGCVVVKDDSVISSGVTSISGRPHAESNALNNDKINLNTTLSGFFRFNYENKKFKLDLNGTTAILGKSFEP